MKRAIVAALAMLLSMGTFAIGQDMGSGNGATGSTKSSKKSTKSAAKSETLSGVVTDEKCAKDSAKAKDADCAKMCIQGGSAMVLVNDKDQSIWKVKNPDALKGHEGHHVSVRAKVDSSDNSIQVVGKPKMIKDKASSAKAS
ncbi:MAG TPA: hypothetical protein VFZ99_06895 [Terriglobales bacterium]